MTRPIRTILAAALRALADRLDAVNRSAVDRDLREPVGGRLPDGVVGYALGGHAR
ncbi:hypothetical protein [Catenuloplanes atrovinosus]|uniref:Uncharacterized protein n=1 Tax=Catenuloplanes atrovinosus TaxID=137266 RepID=A0AAE3YVQ8_9ACTN|nr:hypothetical protein [Catenuloplanes atrovinosus]MDR7278901.1 hypothetical protein [Catenuloplanes atrovinosus]